jgi:hypothetical protein
MGVLAKINFFYVAVVFITLALPLMQEGYSLNGWGKLIEHISEANSLMQSGESGKARIYANLPLKCHW